MSLNAIYRELGAQWTNFADHRLPLFFETGIQKEHQACRESAALFDVSHMGLLFVFGEQATVALEALVPADLKNMRVGAQKYTVLTLPSGGILDDLMITRLQSGWLLVVNAGRKTVDLTHLRTHLPAQVSIEVWRDQRLFALQGPKSVEILKRFGVEIHDWTKMTARFCAPLDAPALISRSGYTGEDGFEILISDLHAENFVEACLHQPEVTMAGLGARDALRLEAGLCLYGQDLTEQITPIEANLTWVIDKRRRVLSPETPSFLGYQTVIEQLHGVVPIARRRVGVISEQKRPLRTGWDIQDETGKVIGVLSSGGYSPCLKRGIGMSYIDVHALNEGVSTVFCEHRQQRYPLTVARLPFI